MTRVLFQRTRQDGSDEASKGISWFFFSCSRVAMKGRGGSHVIRKRVLLRRTKEDGSDEALKEISWNLFFFFFFENGDGRSRWFTCHQVDQECIHYRKHFVESYEIPCIVRVTHKLAPDDILQGFYLTILTLSLQVEGGGLVKERTRCSREMIAISK